MGRAFVGQMQWHRGCLTCASCVAHLQPSTLNEVNSGREVFLPPVLPERSSAIGDWDWDFVLATNFHFSWMVFLKDDILSCLCLKIKCKEVKYPSPNLTYRMQNLTKGV